MAYLAFPTTNYGDDLGLVSAPGGRGESGVGERPGLWIQNELQLLPRERNGGLVFLRSREAEKDVRGQPGDFNEVQISLQTHCF